MNKFYVYILVNSKNNIPFYVGKGSGLRILDHFVSSIKNPKKYLHYKINKFIQENKWPDIKIRFCEDEELAFLLETELISLYGRKDLGRGPLLNQTDGGEGLIGRIISEKTREKMRARRHSEETKKKISVSHIGKHLSKETLTKMSQVQKGKLLSKEHKNNISKARKGWKFSEETLQKLSLAQKGKKKYFSQEHRKNISKSNKGGKRSEETRRKMSIAQKKRFNVISIENKI